MHPYYNVKVGILYANTMIHFKKVYFLVQISNVDGSPTFNIACRTFSKEVAHEMQKILAEIAPEAKTVLVSYTRKQLQEMGY